MNMDLILLLFPISLSFLGYYMMGFAGPH